MGLAKLAFGFITTSLARDVGAMYNLLGYDVQQGVELAGQQIDLLLQKRKAKDEVIRTAVAVKLGRSTPLSSETIASFAAITDVLRQQGLIEEATIVGSAGFSAEARQLAKDHRISAVDIKELRAQTLQRLDEHAIAMEALKRLDASKRDGIEAHKRRVFVLMPFATEFVDVYVYGIRKTAADLGHVADRADDIEHNEDVMQLVRQRIEEADVVVAEMTGKNANVFYEIGYAHALRRPVILICRKGQEVPFDLRSYNYIEYETISQLEEKLSARLKATLPETFKSPQGPTAGLL